MKKPLIFLVALLLMMPLFANAATSTKEVALTFDDGPYGTSTEEILSILKAEHVPATFFVIGKNVEEFPQEAREIVEDGNAIGNHTYDHTMHLSTMPPDEMRDELSKTETLIASTTGVHTTLFRPPYGSVSSALKKELHAGGYRMVLWNVDPQDWNYASATSDVIVQRVLSHLKLRMVIDLHDGRDTHVDYPRGNIITALPILIDNLKERGYTFIKYDDTSPVRN